MRRTAPLVLFALAALAAAGLAGPAFQRFNLHYVTRPFGAAGTVDASMPATHYWYKDHRSRIDIAMPGGDQLMQSQIMDCDSSRMISVDWLQRTYTLTTFDEFRRQQEEMMRSVGMGTPGTPAPSAPEGEARTGGRVVVSTSWRDSMLDEPRFGLPVRWVSMVMEIDASEDACSPQDSRMETHFWTADLDVPLCTPPIADGGGPAAYRPPVRGCEDRIEQKTVGRPAPLDFILRMWTVGEGGMMGGYEVVELSRDELADSLFVPPAGFRRVEPGQTVAGMPGMPTAPAPKAPGAIRVGVAIRLASDAPAAPAQLAADVAEWIVSQGIDAVPLAATERAAALAEAPEVEADYILFYDLPKAQVKASGRGMLGAALGGALGERAGGGAVQLEVEGDYELLRPSGERVTDGEIEEEERAEDPQAQLAEILEGPAGVAIAAIRR
jgi:hypothetical protein